MRTEMLRATSAEKLSSQQPHDPAGYEDAAKKHHETISTIADHVAHVVAVRDAEDNRREDSKHKSCAEMCERNVQSDNPRFMCSARSRNFTSFSQ